MKPCCEAAIVCALEDLDALDHAAENGGRFDCSICGRDLTGEVLGSSCRRILDRIAKSRALRPRRSPTDDDGLCVKCRGEGCDTCIPPRLCAVCHWPLTEGATHLCFE